VDHVDHSVSFVSVQFFLARTSREHVTAELANSTIRPENNGLLIPVPSPFPAEIPYVTFRVTSRPSKRMNKRETQKLCRADSTGLSCDERSFEYHGWFPSMLTRAYARTRTHARSRRLEKKSNGATRYWFQNVKRGARDTTEDKRGDSRMAGYTKRENIIETFLFDETRSSLRGEKGSRYPTGKCLPALRECMLSCMRGWEIGAFPKDGEEYSKSCDC